MVLNFVQLGKRFVRAQFESRGWQIVRRNANNGLPIDLLPLLIEHCVLTEGKGAIIQIGANDGQLADPVHQIIKALSLPAILVEPLPDKFERLRRNYCNQPDIRFENVAIGTEAGDTEFFRVSPAAKHLPEWAQGIASFDKSFLLKCKDIPGIKGKTFVPYIETVRVSVITFDQLLQKHSDVARLTALQVDTEGYDFVVVKAAIAAGCLPRIINYEHRHLSYSDQVSCRELLSSKGYYFWSNWENTVAYKNRSQ